MIKKILKEHKPWNLSYKKAEEARPSWSRHGMPALYTKFIKILGKNHTNGRFHLDIGCGNGVKTVNYALCGLRTIGIDLSDDGFIEARELIRELRISRKCKVIQANCLKLPFKDDSVMSASDTLCFTHIKPKDQRLYKKELFRVLKAGSFVLMVLFSNKDKHFHGHTVSQKYTFKFDPNNPLMERFAHYHGMYNYHYDKNEIKKTFDDMFELVEVAEFIHPLYPHRYLWNIILRKSGSNESKLN